MSIKTYALSPGDRLARVVDGKPAKYLKSGMDRCDECHAAAPFGEFPRDDDGVSECPSCGGHAIVEEDGPFIPITDAPEDAVWREAWERWCVKNRELCEHIGIAINETGPDQYLVARGPGIVACDACAEFKELGGAITPGWLWHTNHKNPCLACNPHALSHRILVPLSNLEEIPAPAPDGDLFAHLRADLPGIVVVREDRCTDCGVAIETETVYCGTCGGTGRVESAEVFWWEEE